MKRIVTGQEPVLYVEQRTGLRFWPPLVAMGLECDGEMIAGIVFNGYNGCAVELTIAGEKRAFTRAFIRRIADYVFREMGCLRASFTTEQSHVVDLLHRLGAQTEGRKRNHFGEGRDGMILGILREDWKF
jgi:RimJ/RimL family protein N-acetyltransferase